MNNGWMKMSKKIKIILIICGIVLVSFLIYRLNYWYHTRISSKTPQAKSVNCPNDKPIKGNAQSGIYHIPDGQYYIKTRPERCFATEEEAQKADYRKSKK